MSLFRGLAWGIVIGALQIAAGHMAFEYKDVSFQGNPALATAVPVVLLPLAIGYVGGLFLALVLPTLTMGAVAGTAAGHSWQKPRARGAISFLAVLVLLVGVFELRMTSLTSLIRP